MLHTKFIIFLRGVYNKKNSPSLHSLSESHDLDLDLVPYPLILGDLDLVEYA